ncbi:putative electron transfer flavoprotein subunit [Cichlidogyrus casuarinus]|uniref:Electron transfer flavoprotein subunit n=1 Tax=Cichlidogyrus casuarinus TaxID=1844966 RepID=A0ABD2QDI6_9PLAT
MENQTTDGLVYCTNCVNRLSTNLRNELVQSLKVACESSKAAQQNSASLRPHSKQAKCSNCGTESTSMWRRDSNNDIVCNPCGLYQRLHGLKRPLYLTQNVFKTRRKRKSNQPVHIKSDPQPHCPSVKIDEDHLSESS